MPVEMETEYDLAADHPALIEWRRWSKTADYRIAIDRAKMYPKVYMDPAMWEAFWKGWTGAMVTKQKHERAASSTASMAAEMDAEAARAEMDHRTQMENLAKMFPQPACEPDIPVEELRRKWAVEQVIAGGAMGIGDIIHRADRLIAFVTKENPKPDAPEQAECEREESAPARLSASSDVVDAGECALRKIQNECGYAHYPPGMARAIAFAVWSEMEKARKR